VRRAMAGENQDAIANAVESLDGAAHEFAERRMDRGIRGALAGVEVGNLEDRLSKE